MLGVRHASQHSTQHQICKAFRIALSIIFGTLVSMEEPDPKVRENRLRRMAARQGYQLHKKRRIDPRAADYGTYQLVPAKGKPRDFESIDAVEEFLTR